MSVHALLQAAVRDALGSHAPLGGAVTAIFDAPPVRGLRPYAVIEDAVLSDWGTKDCAGREGRFAVLLFDEGESPARLRGLAAAAEAAMAGCARDLGDGWRVASLIFVRSRIARERDGRWLAACEWRVRMLQQ